MTNGNNNWLDHNDHTFEESLLDECSPCRKVYSRRQRKPTKRFTYEKNGKHSYKEINISKVLKEGKRKPKEKQSIKIKINLEDIKHHMDKSPIQQPMSPPESVDLTKDFLDDDQFQTPPKLLPIQSDNEEKDKEEEEMICNLDSARLGALKKNTGLLVFLKDNLRRLKYVDYVTPMRKQMNLAIINKSIIGEKLYCMDDFEPDYKTNLERIIEKEIQAIDDFILK